VLNLRSKADAAGLNPYRVAERAVALQLERKYSSRESMPQQTDPLLRSLGEARRSGETPEPQGSPQSPVQTLRLYYTDRSIEELVLRDARVECVDHRIVRLAGLRLVGEAYEHPDPYRLAAVLDIGSGVAHPRA